MLVAMFPWPCYMMSKVGNLAVFQSQNCQLIGISCYKHVYMFLPCSYAFGSSLIATSQGVGLNTPQNAPF